MSFYIAPPKALHEVVCQCNRTYMIAFASPQSHRAVAGLAGAACAALQNMTAENLENRKRSGAVGAVEAVVSALQLHKARQSVAEHGCGAVRPLHFLRYPFPPHLISFRATLFVSHPVNTKYRTTLAHRFMRSRSWRITQRRRRTLAPLT